MKSRLVILVGILVVCLAFNGLPVSAASSITLNPTSLNFGTQVIGTTSAVQLATFTNRAASPLTINSIKVNGATAADYIYTTTCGASLQGYSSCYVRVFFRPTNINTRPAQIDITHSSGTSSLPLSGVGTRNLIRNPGMELDDDHDGKPDGWTTSPFVSRSTDDNNSGHAAMEHESDTDASYSISQRIQGIQGGQSAGFLAWISIPATTDTFAFDFSLEWLNAKNASLGSVPLRHFSAATDGWVWGGRYLVAPPGATDAILTMQATSLNASIYVDDLFLGNLLVNGGFENDTNNDTRPDSWTSDKHVTRTNAMVHGGYAAMRHTATDNATYSIAQTVRGIVAGQEYPLGSWVNIPPTNDAFSFQVQLIWLDSNGLLITSRVVRTFTGPTNGWEAANGYYVAPPGATSAVIRMNVSSLNATIYVDDVTFWP